MSGVASRAINMVMRLSLSAALPLSSCASRVPAPVGDVPILAYYETDLAIQLSGGETLSRKLGKSKTTKIFEAKAYIKEAGFVGTDVVVSVKDGPYSVLKAGEALAKFRVARSDYANSTGNGIEVYCGYLEGINGASGVGCFADLDGDNLFESWYLTPKNFGKTEEAATPISGLQLADGSFVPFEIRSLSRQDRPYMKYFVLLSYGRSGEALFRAFLFPAMASTPNLAGDVKLTRSSGKLEEMTRSNFFVGGTAAQNILFGGIHVRAEKETDDRWLVSTEPVEDWMFITIDTTAG